MGNIPAWSFDPDSILGIFLFDHVVLEDVLFIPACTNLFYFFCFATRKIPDIFKDNIYFHCTFIVSIICALSWLYVTAGKGYEQLHIAFILTPAIAYTLIINYYNIKINFTHAYLMLIFLMAFSNTWEFTNAFKLGHWFYNIACNLLSKAGFMLKGKLHTSISFGYNLAGYIVFYGAMVITVAFDKGKITKKSIK